MECCEDKMFIFEKYYNRLEGYDISNHIIDMFDEGNCPLSDKQKEYLRRFQRFDYPFQAYTWRKGKSENKTLMQMLSTPVMLLLILIIGITYCPLKFLFTGKYMINENDKSFRWLYKFAVYALNDEH